MVKTCGKALLGLCAAAAVLALLIHWITPATILHYREDLLFYLQAHLVLVFSSMAAALLVGVPAGILLSRPGMQAQAERLMQVFNVGNTIPPLAVLAIALALNVGSAPLAFLIGANSLGSLIFPGIYLNNHQQLLLGAACTALLALLLDALVVLFSRMFLERGLTAKEA
ncbi:hypothetical protein IPC1146_03985 [Pseudomonas aeruginosa]|uniref:hypothetical protein n=1 Tax=Pseudomonas aeruginosa TaxID=287 RepID=UPI000FD2DF0B|nr:hypothetical protein [Pseudomonas aeruginosa]RUF18628.1 hypothetical protein IPC1146_03985 [Pseudomonas aeruginosa]